jgi:hypothetical protein
MKDAPHHHRSTDMNNQDCKPDTESEFQEWRAGEIQSRAVLGASIDV